MLYASIIYQPLCYTPDTTSEVFDDFPFPVTHCYSLRKIVNGVQFGSSYRVRIIEVQLSQDFQAKVVSGQLFDMGGSTVKNKTIKLHAIRNCLYKVYRNYT